MQIPVINKKIWLSSPTVHGDQLRYATEAYETNGMSIVGADIFRPGLCLPSDSRRAGCDYCCGAQLL